MLRLLLDEHVSPKVAVGLRRKYPSLLVVSFAEWSDGEFLGRDDAECLQQAAQQGLTLMTYDRRTIPPLLKAWAEVGRSHGGIVFADEKTIPPNDIGGLVKALSALWEQFGRREWRDRICFLQR